MSVTVTNIIYEYPLLELHTCVVAMGFLGHVNKQSV
jgi:hypothetical protein